MKFCFSYPPNIMSKVMEEGMYLQFSLSPPNRSACLFKLGRPSKCAPLVISTSLTDLGSFTITHHEDPNFMENILPYSRASFENAAYGICNFKE